MSAVMWRMVLLLLLLGSACGISTAQTSVPPATTASPAAAGEAATLARLQRGQYLVEQVAMCVQCHTPRTAQGDLDHTRLLQGASIPVPGPFPAQPWAFEAPKIAGLPGWTAEDAMQLLQTGSSARGYVPRPPMPPFRLTREDAEAIVAYLKSLP